MGEEVGDAERSGETGRGQREQKRRRHRQNVDVGARRRTSTLARWQPVPYNNMCDVINLIDDGTGIIDLCDGDG